MSHTLYPAWDTQTNRIIYATKNYKSYTSLGINTLPKDKSNFSKGRFKCLECYEDVFPKKGDSKAWHFSHYSNSTCSSSSTQPRPGESLIHKYAKYRLVEFLRHKHNLTILHNKCLSTQCTTTPPNTQILHEEGDTVFAEFKLPNSSFRADIAIVNNNIIRYIFEIYNTSKTQTFRPEPWFEIKASEIQSQLQPDTHTITLKDIKPFCCDSCPQIPSSSKSKIHIKQPKHDRGLGMLANMSTKTRNTQISCTGRGKCLQQKACQCCSTDDFGYCKNQDTCCKPIPCSQCNKYFPQWVLDCFSGKICSTCDSSRWPTPNSTK